MARIFDKEVEASQGVIKDKLSSLSSLYGEDNLAEWSRCSVHMIRKYRNVNESDHHMPAANLRLLSRKITTMQNEKIIKDFTDGEMGLLLLPSGKSDGKIEDDIKELLKAGGEAASCFDAGDSDGYFESLKDLMKVVENMKEEGKGL